MRRRRLIWFAVLASFVAAHVIPAPSVEAGGYTRRTVLNGTPFPSTLVVLVDNSGSMQPVEVDVTRVPWRPGTAFACAIRQATWVAEQASDGARVRFAAFGGEIVWERFAWTKLPDAEAVAISRAWLMSQGTGGSTAMAHAIESVLEIDEPDLGVVLISDCQPDGGYDDTRARIERANARRKSAATIGIISVAPGADAKRFAMLVAGAAGGPVVELEAKSDKDGAQK